MERKGCRIGCLSGCKKNFWTMMVLFIFFLGGAIPLFVNGLSNLPDNFYQVQESDVVTSPILEQDYTTLHQEFYDAGLIQLSNDINAESLENNTESLTKDLVLTDRQFGAMLNKLFFPSSSHILQCSITATDTVSIEFIIAIKGEDIEELKLFKDYTFYINVNILLTLNENVYTCENISTNMLGIENMDEVSFDDEELFSQILGFFYDEGAFLSKINASHIIFSNGQLTAVANTTNT